MGWLSDRVERHIGANVPVRPKEQPKQGRPERGSLRRREEGQR